MNKCKNYEELFLFAYPILEDMVGWNWGNTRYGRTADQLKEYQEHIVYVIVSLQQQNTPQTIIIGLLESVLPHLKKLVSNKSDFETKNVFDLLMKEVKEQANNYNTLFGPMVEKQNLSQAIRAPDATEDKASAFKL